MIKRRTAALVLAAGFTLGICRGRVALWRDGKPVLVTEMPVELLPEADQRALERGIEIPEACPVGKYVEDFCS